jgi:hypothetical protein
MPADESADVQSRRPALKNRHSSTGSAVSQSLSDTSSSHHGHHKTQRHVVGGGHGRLGARNTSLGKNLNKLHHHHHNATGSSKQHTRSTSGDLATSTSPGRPTHAVKRNASASVIPRNTSHSALKKNRSSGHLPRHGSSKNIMKQARHQALPAKRTRSNRSEKSEKSETSVEPASPPEPTHPTVRFDLGHEEHGEGEDAWESTSQSPNTTRTHTRQSSVAGESATPSRSDSAADVSNQPPQADISRTDTQTPPQPHSDNPSSQESPLPQMNGAKLTGYHSSRPPDPDAITSRLLQRSTSHNADPQISNALVTVTANAHDVRSLSHSQGSTLADGTPGRDLVSRFIRGGSGSGTPQSSFLPDADHVPNPRIRKGGLDDSRRNKSTPDMAEATRPSSASTTIVHSRGRVGPPTPKTDLPPSRTQQKLLLQRASSTIEPQKIIPAVLPRPGAPQLLGSGAPFHLAAGRLSDPSALPAQIAALFHEAGKEYNVIRRYRDPVADSLYRVRRLQHTKEGRERWVNPPSRKGKSPTPDARSLDGREPKSVQHRPTSSRDSMKRSVDREMHPHHPPPANIHVTAPQDERGRERQHRGDRVEATKAGHKARVSFDLPSTPQEEGGGHESFGSNSDSGRPPPDEAYEICRRLWEGIGLEGEGAGVGEVSA